MTATGWILFWWALFAGTHVLGSSLPVRSRLVGAMGLAPFKGLYSLVALGTFVPLCLVYFDNKHSGAYLFSPFDGSRHVTETLMLLALFVLIQGLISGSPLTTVSELTGRTPPVRGIQRVTRHPMNLAFGLFGLAHCLVNPFSGDWAFFGGFVVYALLSSLHQDRRTLAAGSEPARRFVRETSYLPFVAVLAGRQRLAAREFSLAGLGAALAAWALLRFFHGDIFGGFAT